VVDTTSHPGSQNDPALLLSHPQLAGCMGISVPLPGEESQRRHLDADGYLLKPVSRQSLWDALRRFGERVDRILLVDDDDGFVQLMRRLLQDPVRRYQVQGVGSGTEALAAIERQTPDLVLLDLMLPDMTGDQVLATIRGDQRWPHLPVIIVSAQDDPGQAQALQGPMTISRAGGLLPSQALRLLQATLETASGPDRSRATP